jgi:hypothetical protein
LFKNHKAAQVLSDQSAFQVLQTASGQSLFFGIGDDDVLYLSAEQVNTTTGWNLIPRYPEEAFRSLDDARLMTAKRLSTKVEMRSSTLRSEPIT